MAAKDNKAKKKSYSRASKAHSKLIKAREAAIAEGKKFRLGGGGYLADIRNAASASEIKAVLAKLEQRKGMGEKLHYYAAIQCFADLGEVREAVALPFSMHLAGVEHGLVKQACTVALEVGALACIAVQQSTHLSTTNNTAVCHTASITNNITHCQFTRLCVCVCVSALDVPLTGVWEA